MSYKNIKIEKSANIKIISINRPEKLNALNNDTLTELELELDKIKKDDDIYVVIITGEGVKAFVAGADISEINKLNPVNGKKFAEYGQSVFYKIHELGKPVIAAVNGFALGGGCELAMACHIRFASENAKFGQPEVNLGIIPGYGGTQRLTRLVNSGRALELILSGNMIDAAEAYRIGLVSKVFPQENLLEETIKFASIVASKGQAAVRMSLKSVLAAENTSEKEGENLESSLFAICCGTEDFKEGTAAFLEKRKPDFKGN